MKFILNSLKNNLFLIFFLFFYPKSIFFFLNILTYKFKISLSMLILITLFIFVLLNKYYYIIYIKKMIATTFFD